MARRRKANQAKPSLNTADYLARAVYDGLYPDHPQTREDYGFNRAVTVEEKCNLLSLYTDLIESIGVSAKTLHDWRVRGVLVDEIKAAFSKIPEGSRGAYFPWFLQNQHIIALAGQPRADKEFNDHGDVMILRSWRFTGGSEQDSAEEIRAAIERKPVEEQKCYLFYTVLLSGFHPASSLELWIDFGFASCTSRIEEVVLRGRYQQLIAMCTFKEFCDAYRKHRLLDLFHSKGLPVDDSDQLRDILSGNGGWKKSVWYLKQFVLQEGSPTENPIMVPSIMVDYGFINCRNTSESRELEEVYKDFFNHHGDPLALHDAAMKGNLYGFLSNTVQGVRGPKFQRFMKTPYPLPYLAMQRRSLLSAWQAPSFIFNTQTLLFVVLLGGVLLGIFLMRLFPL